MQDPTTQTHETFFLAKTDSEPPHLREIYYWLYDEAIKHGFQPNRKKKMYCYLYKKGSKEWLLVGKGSSYHEEEFLHSINHTLSVKFAFPKIYHTHPEKIEWLKHRFPASFATRWGGAINAERKKGRWKHAKTALSPTPTNGWVASKGIFTSITLPSMILKNLLPCINSKIESRSRFWLKILV
jgi:hypothetical protein